MKENYNERPEDRGDAKTEKLAWETPCLEEVSERLMAQPTSGSRDAREGASVSDYGAPSSCLAADQPLHPRCLHFAARNPAPIRAGKTSSARPGSSRAQIADMGFRTSLGGGSPWGTPRPAAFEILAAAASRSRSSQRPSTIGSTASPSRVGSRYNVACRPDFARRARPRKSHERLRPAVPAGSAGRDRPPAPRPAWSPTRIHPV